MSNKVLFNKDLESVKKGIDIVHQAVVGTIGAAGKNVMFKDWTQQPVVTNDGYTIAEEINLEDESENLGANFMKQASRRQNSEAADGTTSTIAIAHAMIEKGIEKLNAGANAMKLKRQMDSSVDELIVKLRKSSQKIKDDKGLFDVANLSMENQEMAKIVVDAVKACGENGRVVVQESNLVVTKTEEATGIDFPSGYISPYMITDATKLISELDNVHVLVTDKTFNQLNQLLPVMNTLKAKGFDKLLVICHDMIGESLGNVIVNIQKGVFLAVAVQMPADKDLLDDIAILTGAQKISEINVPEGLSELHVNYLGKAKRVIVSRDKTIIDGGEGLKDVIKDRILALKNEIKDKEKDGQFVGDLKARLAKLDGKVVYIKVGAPTQQEMKYLKLKIDDAVASAIAAKKSGVIVGGGRALYDLSTQKPSNDGEDVVLHACSMPIKRIIENAKKNPDEILKILKRGQAWNALTEEPVKDFLKEGLVDPVDITIWALKNAVSTAGMFLTTFSAIVNIPKKDIK